MPLQDDHRATTYWRAAGLSLIYFFVLGSYSLARSATDSLFLEVHTSRGLPAVWVMVAVATILSVMIYNHLVARYSLMGVFAGVTIFSGALLGVLLLGQGSDLPGIHHILYIWKDVYVVLVVENFYSYANSVFAIQTARWVYGLFGSIGGVGAIAGNMLVGHSLSGSLGTVGTLWTVVPLLVGLGLVGLGFDRRLGVDNPIQREEGRHVEMVEGIRVALRSNYLLLVMCLIALVQSVITIIDFNFNEVVEAANPEMDSRTAVFSSIYATVSTFVVLFHGTTGPVLRLLGVPLTLLGIPALLAAGVVLYALRPGFNTISVIKVASKSLDYTLLRNAKEILYIPLTYRERTQGKAVVDMLTYRIAKAAVSGLLAAALVVGSAGLVNGLTLGLLAGWFGVTLVVVRQFRRKVSRQEEMGKFAP